MKPILLIHGYSSEGKKITVSDIYGSLPSSLQEHYGEGVVLDLNLSRWISLNDGISLDDVSFAMDRALRSKKYKHLLESSFNVIIHSTGALVVRNWIRLYSPKPSPIDNIVHLAGANFGSGLAHIGKGQMSRWGRQIIGGTNSGVKVLNELEFGSWKTLDLHLNFLNSGQDIYEHYMIQEFCLIGSQTLDLFRFIPIRYIKEDSSDNTVRTSACNLNFNYIQISPNHSAYALSIKALHKLIESRLNNALIDDKHYEFNLDHLSKNHRQVPFAVVYETAHFSDDIGIVAGTDNRDAILPLIYSALETPFDESSYQQTAEQFEQAHAHTFDQAKELDSNIFEWNKQSQYEGHAQLIFRVVDQFNHAVEHIDITIKSKTNDSNKQRLEKMIEDRHNNKCDKGTITFYLRTQSFDEETKDWIERLDNVSDVDIEISGYEPLSGDIAYLPVCAHFTALQIQQAIQSFKTTIIDVTLLRLPSQNVFKI